MDIGSGGTLEPLGLHVTLYILTAALVENLNALQAKPGIIMLA